MGRIRLSHWLAGSALALSLAGLVPGGAAAAVEGGNKWSAYVDVGGELGDREKGEVNAFIPVMQNRAGMVFADLRGKLFSEGALEGNFGVGYRQLMSGDAIAGVYGFFDLRRSENDNTFQQITFGAEYLTTDWELRGNIYLPLDDAENVSPAFGVGGTPSLVIEGGNLVLQRQGATLIEELALWGFDVETGFLLPAFTDDPDQEIRAFGGAFYFDHDELDSDERFVGPMARIEYRIYDVLGLGPQSRFTLAGEGRWDEEREGQGFVSATVRIPLQSFVGARYADSLTPLERRMVDPIRRDVDIVTSEHKSKIDTEENVINVENGREIQGVTTVSGAGNVSAEVADAGADSIVVLDGTLGDFNDGATVVLSRGQVLMGGGSSLAVRGVTSGTNATFTADGTRATLGGGGATQTLVAMANDSIVLGLDLRDGDNAIDASGTKGARVIDTQIFNPGASGVFATNTVDLVIRDSMIDGAGGDGIFHTDSTRTVIRSSVISNSAGNGILGARGVDMRVNGLTVTGSGVDGVGLFNMTDLSFSNVTVDQTGAHGVSLAGNGLSANGLTVSNTGGDGVRISNSTDVELRNATLSGIGTTGIALGGGATGITDALIANVSVDGANEGLTIFGGTGARNVTIQSFSIANSTASGIRVEDGGDNVRIRNGTISMSGSDGILANMTNGLVIRDVAVADSGNGGIGVFGATDTTIVNVSIDSTAGWGINATSDGLLVDQVAMSNIGGDGLRISNSTNIGLHNLMLTNIGATAVVIGGGANGVSELTMANIVVDGANTGISLWAGTGLDQIVVRDSSFNGITGTGLFFNGTNNASLNSATFTNLHFGAAAAGGQNAVNIFNLGANADVTMDGLTTAGPFTGTLVSVTAASAGASFTLNNAMLVGTALNGLSFGGPLAIGGTGNTLDTNGIAGTFCQSGAGVTGSVAYEDSGGTAQTCP